MPTLSRSPFRARPFALINCLALLFVSAFPCLADSFSWDANAQGQFITFLCRDTRGNVWIGTEDKGVYRLDPTAPKSTQYTHFTTKDGLGDDNAYALTCDLAGRVWVGTLNHGVSVFNGKTWKTYGPLDGPLGSRVFALAVSPKDGGVWGATEAGLFRYQNSRWSYFARAEGLPSDQANALAFDADGTLYVGTQCDGIAMASPTDGYKSWRVIPGPEQIPNTAMGYGLPSALINCLLVTANGTIYAGTPSGLAQSSEAGLNWHYRRGLDWKAKLAGLSPPMTPDPGTVVGNLLREDYVTCLGEDGLGRVFIGHRQGGVEVFDPKFVNRVQSGANAGHLEDYEGALLVENKSVWVGMYGGGLLPPTTEESKRSDPNIASSQFPISAKPPTLGELDVMLRAVNAAAPDKAELLPHAVALQDDWLTEGDWLGRYGRYWACLCAMSSGPLNYIWGAGGQKVDYRTRIGPNHLPKDKLRYFVTWKYTANPRSLELPPTYLDSRVRQKLTTWNVNRRQSEADDHGETYPMSQDGPDVHCNLVIPAGLFVLSLYDFNKDGHTDNNRYRDYRVSVRPLLKEKLLKDTSYFDRQPEMAHSRIQSFWGGVWKRFLVRGPCTLGVEVNRNNSFNAILPAVMLDKVEEEPSPYFQHADTKQPVGTATADRLLSRLEVLRQTNSVWWASNSSRYYKSLLRWYRVQNNAGCRNKPLLARLGTCYYQSGMFASWEECQNKRGMTTARQIEKQLRWDGVTDTDSDFVVVTKFLQNHPKIKTYNYRLADSLPEHQTKFNHLSRTERKTH